MYKVRRGQNMPLEEEERNAKMEKRVDEINALFQQATKKDDLDFILKRFSIKCLKNNKKSSAISFNMKIKIKIIKMAIEEPEDTFDYDFFVMSMKTVNP